MKALMLSLASFAALWGCTERKFNSSRPQEYTRPYNVHKLESVPIRLENLARALQDSGLRYEDIVEDIYWEGDAFENRFLRVDFRSLSLEACRVLATTYANSWKEGLITRQECSGRVFDLVDFLSPYMQATVGRNFSFEMNQFNARLITEEIFNRDVPLFWRQRGVRWTPSSYALDSDGLQSNCWATAYEAARRSTGQATVQLLSDKSFLATLNNPAFSVPRTDAAIEGKNATKRWVTSHGVKFGDLLVAYYSDGSVAHAAVFVDENVVYEKITNLQPYRLSTLDELLATYEQHSYRIFRTVADLPHVTSVDTSERLPSYGDGILSYFKYLSHDFTLVKDSLGRYSLPAEVLSAILPPGEPIVPPTPVSTGCTLQGDSDTVLLRDARGEARANLKKGTEVTRIGATQNGMLVRLQGFVHASNTSCAQNFPQCSQLIQVQDANPTQLGTVWGTNLRQTDSSSSASLGVITNGSPLKNLTTQANRWILVSIEGEIPASSCR